jgi:hypothetical protein
MCCVGREEGVIITYLDTRRISTCFRKFDLPPTNTGLHMLKPSSMRLEQISKQILAIESCNQRDEKRSEIWRGEFYRLARRLPLNKRAVHGSGRCIACTVHGLPTDTVKH